MKNSCCGISVGGVVENELKTQNMFAQFYQTQKVA